jgi:hypothetical protein
MKAIKAYFWLLFVFNQWPWKPAGKYGWDLAEHLLKILRILINIIAIPFWPPLIAIGMICSGKYRKVITDGFTRKAKRPIKAEGTWKITVNP